MAFRDLMQSRKDDIELGRGVWRRAHDRFTRGIDRFHQILEQLPNDETLELMVPAANRLADLLPRVRKIAVDAQRLAPSQDNDIPAIAGGAYSDLHRCLSKAGNAVALCAEALAVIRCGGGCEVQCSRQQVVDRRVENVLEHVQAAEALVARLGACTRQRLASMV